VEPTTFFFGSFEDFISCQTVAFATAWNDYTLVFNSGLKQPVKVAHRVDVIFPIGRLSAVVALSSTATTLWFYGVIQV